MCTRVLWNNNKLGVLAGRTMDWPESTEPVLTVAPRGYERHGGKAGPLDVVRGNALEWMVELARPSLVQTSHRRVVHTELAVGTCVVRIE